jgi:hypothetical protein
MRKTEIKKLNQFKRATMEDVRGVSKSKVYRLGYKHGYNVARREIRKILILDNDKPLS